jgi:hypothetical protein
VRGERMERVGGRKGERTEEWEEMREEEEGTKEHPYIQSGQFFLRQTIPELRYHGISSILFCKFF